MPTKQIRTKGVRSPGGDVYFPRQGLRDWVCHKKPYYLNIGAFQSYGRDRKSGLYQDSYWSPNTDTGKNWFCNTGVESLLRDPSYDSFSIAVHNKCVSKLQADIAKSDFNLAVSGAEASKTVQHIANTAGRVLRAAVALKKGRLGDAYRALGHEVGMKRLPKSKKVRSNAASYWLELQYAWGPLLSDIHGACQALATRLNEPKVPIFYAESRSGQQSFNQVRYRSGDSSWSIDTHLEIKLKEVCRIGVYYRIRNGNIVQAARLGLTNPALVVWELVPFSFVVDWFLPVGNFLSQLSAYHGLEFVQGYRTQYFKEIALHDGSNKAQMRISGSSFWSSYRQRRTQLTDFPTAHLLIKDPFSVGHGVTTLALLNQVLGGFSTKNLRR